MVKLIIHIQKKETFPSQRPNHGVNMMAVKFIEGSNCRSNKEGAFIQKPKGSLGVLF